MVYLSHFLVMLTSLFAVICVGEHVNRVNMLFVHLSFAYLQVL